MADLTSTYIATNYNQIVNANGLGGRTLIVTVVKDAGDMTEAQFVTVLQALCNAGGSGNGTDTNGPDAFTVAGIADFDGTDPVYVALQGNGTVNTTPVTGYTVTVVATFADAV